MCAHACKCGVCSMCVVCVCVCTCVCEFVHAFVVKLASIHMLLRETFEIYPM